MTTDLVLKFLANLSCPVLKGLLRISLIGSGNGSLFIIFFQQSSATSDFPSLRYTNYTSKIQHLLYTYIYIHVLKSDLHQLGFNIEKKLYKEEAEKDYEEGDQKTLLLHVFYLLICCLRIFWIYGETMGVKFIQRETL